MKNKAVIALFIAMFLLALAPITNSQDMLLNNTYVNVNVLDSIALIITELSSSATYNGAEITWTTNRAANSTVVYGINASLENGTYLVLTNSSYSVSHDVALSGLSSSRTYFYNVTSCDANNNCTTEGIFNFTTSAAPVAPKGGGGSGGGGGVVMPKCVSIWYCDLWPICENGTRTRICDDLMGCKDSRYETEICVVKEVLPRLEIPGLETIGAKINVYLLYIQDVIKLLLSRIGIIISISILMLISLMLFFVYLKEAIEKALLDKSLLIYVRRAIEKGFKEEHIIERLTKEGMHAKEIAKYIKYAKKELKKILK